MAHLAADHSILLDLRYLRCDHGQLKDGFGAGVGVILNHAHGPDDPRIRCCRFAASTSHPL